MISDRYQNALHLCISFGPFVKIAQQWHLPNVWKKLLALKNSASFVSQRVIFRTYLKFRSLLHTTETPSQTKTTLMVRLLICGTKYENFCQHLQPYFCVRMCL